MKSISKRDIELYFVSKSFVPNRTKWIVIVYIFFLALSTMLICSKSSPFYPMNDSVDANAFFTIGRSMKSGYVPYRDFYDHKGPFLFFLHWVAACISDTSFFGVFLMEVASATLFLILCYKTISLYVDRGFFIYLPVVAVLTYASRPFIHGDFVEEFSLPMLMYAVYIGLRYIHSDIEIKKKEWFLIGILSGCVMLMKFTILGFYVGWILVPAYLMIKSRMMHDLIKGVLCLTCGVCAVTIPFLIYFGIHAAVGDWIQVYVVDNLTGYATFNGIGVVGSVIKNLITGLSVSLMYSPMIYVMFIIGLIWLLMSDKRTVGVYWILQFLLLHFTVYCGGRYYAYYAFDHSLFYIPGVIALIHIIYAKSISIDPSWKSGCIGFVVFVLCICMEYCLGYNTYLIFRTKEDMPQYQMASVIENQGMKEPTVLTYDTMDIGLYFACGVTPPCRFFYKPNVSLDEPKLQQDRLISDGSVDYVAVRGSALSSKNYEMVYKTHGIFEEHDYPYALYRRVERGR